MIAFFPGIRRNPKSDWSVDPELLILLEIGAVDRGHRDSASAVLRHRQAPDKRRSAGQLNVRRLRFVCAEGCWAAVRIQRIHFQHGGRLRIASSPFTSLMDCSESFGERL